MNPIYTRKERLSIHFASHPLRWALGLFIGGFLAGVLAILLIHFIWLHTVFQDRLEREMNKKLVYQVYQQRTCVAKWRMTSDCVEWTK